MAELPSFETPFDTYHATKIIGEGGAGMVYEVTNSSGETFALKCLSPERVTSERLKRFKNEIMFCQQQDHPNIIKVFDTGVVTLKDTKCPFYLMRLYSKTLRTAIGQLVAEDRLKLFSQMLDGVEVAHLSSVWHRDLKPENLLISDDLKSLVVADFGIAHFEEEEIYTTVATGPATRMANFQYSAPEQRARGAKVDHHADIFALGLILTEMFTMEVPQGVGYKRIGSVVPEYQYLDDIVESMIQQQPENRVSSIEEIKKALIGRKLAFVSLQQFDELKRHIVPTAHAPQFDAIKIIDLDYHNGTLTLELNKNAPPGWIQEFQSPRGGHSSLWGYGPEQFHISGKTMSIGVREDERFIQQLVDYAKNYIEAANRGYQMQLQERAVHEERERRVALEKATTEAELRKNILSRIKF